MTVVAEAIRIILVAIATTGTAYAVINWMEASRNFVALLKSAPRDPLLSLIASGEVEDQQRICIAQVTLLVIAVALLFTPPADSSSLGAVIAGLALIACILVLGYHAYRRKVRRQLIFRILRERRIGSSV